MASVVLRSADAEHRLAALDAISHTLTGPAAKLAKRAAAALRQADESTAALDRHLEEILTGQTQLKLR